MGKQVDTQRSGISERFRMQLRQVSKGLCEPTLETNFSFAGHVESQSSDILSDGGSSLGWECMVAPIHKTHRQKLPSNKNSSGLGNVFQLPGGTHAPSKVAPSLCSAIREGLQRKQVSPENIENNLKQIKSLSTYEKALWHFCVDRGGDPLSMSLEEVGSWILRFAQVQPNQARNAYSAFLNIPGWEHLKFCSSVKQAKRLWSTSSAKYADFWDAKEVVDKLRKNLINLSNVQQVRDRCILLLRLFHLCRSVDLAQARRVKAPSGGEVYWLLKRKGRTQPAFEALIGLPDKHMSPLFLLHRYVALTSDIGTKGGPIFLSLNPPFSPLTANSIGRITKKLLSELGVPMSVYGPHSTRGASVKMFKSVGLPSEVVCELVLGKTVKHSPSTICGSGLPGRPDKFW